MFLVQNFTLSEQIVHFLSKTLSFQSKSYILSSIHYIFTPSCAIVQSTTLLFRFKSCFQPKTFLFIFSPNRTFSAETLLSQSTLLFQCKLYVFRLKYTFLVVKFTFSVQIARKHYFFSPSFIFSVQNFTFPV